MFGSSEIQAIFSDNAAQWDLLVNFATFGLNTIWKMDLEANIAGLQPETILELGAGTGALTFSLARDFPNSTIYALDMSIPYLQIAHEKAVHQQLDNIQFVRGDAQTPSASLPRGFKADLVISSYLAKYLDNQVFVKDVTKIIKPGGLLVIHELSYPADDILAQLIYNNHIRLFTFLLSFNPLWQDLASELNNIFINNQWEQQLYLALRKKDYQIKVNTIAVSTIIYAKAPL